MHAMKHAFLACGLALASVACPGGLAHAAEAPAKPGYLVVTGWYKDNGVQRQYTQAIGPILREHGFETAVIGLQDRNLRVIEGEWNPGRVMLLKFPGGDKVKEFWWSDAYREARKIRLGASLLDVVKLDGVPGVVPVMNGRNAYLVFVADVKDMKRLLDDYAPFAPKVVASYGGEFLVRSGRPQMELLEGDFPPGSLIVVEFPDVKSMRDFWNSDEYKRLSGIRKSTGKWSVAEITPP
jgi:uncharacterized protein (DUF1330 family)